MDRQNVILALGLLLVLANAIASGEMQSLWNTVKGTGTNSTTTIGGTTGGGGGINIPQNGSPPSVNIPILPFGGANIPVPIPSSNTTTA
jgi:hypothetical protein